MQRFNLAVRADGCSWVCHPGLLFSPTVFKINLTCGDVSLSFIDPLKDGILYNKNMLAMDDGKYSPLIFYAHK